MDPLTALGAAGSIVGIAGLDLQISQTLYQFISTSREARSTVRAVLNGLNSTSAAMRSLQVLLDKEDKRRAEKIKPIFTAEALRNIKDHSDQCLTIFWRIEALITNKLEDNLLEKDIAVKLAIFNSDSRSVNKSKVLELDSLGVLTKMQCLKWPYVSPRLKEYAQRLSSLQLGMILMIQVVSLATGEGTAS